MYIQCPLKHNSQFSVCFHLLATEWEPRENRIAVIAMQSVKKAQVKFKSFKKGSGPRVVRTNSAVKTFRTLTSEDLLEMQAASSVATAMKVYFLQIIKFYY